MGKWLKYKAFVIPGLEELDRDEGLRIGIQWLSRQDPGTLPIILMNAAKMVHHAPLLSRAASQVTVVSPQSRNHPHGTPCWVLAVWPTEGTLALGEEFAHGGGLCVIPGSIGGADSWILARQPEVLGGHDMDMPTISISEEAIKTLKLIDGFDGHNDFVGGGGKEYAIRGLREFQQKGELDPDAIHAWLLANGECSAKGADRMRQWAREILQGRKHRVR